MELWVVGWHGDVVSLFAAGSLILMAEAVTNCELRKQVQRERTLVDIVGKRKL